MDNANEIRTLISEKLEDLSRDFESSLYKLDYNPDGHRLCEGFEVEVLDKKYDIEFRDNDYTYIVDNYITYLKDEIDKIIYKKISKLSYNIKPENKVTGSQVFEKELESLGARVSRNSYRSIILGTRLGINSIGNIRNIPNLIYKDLIENENVEDRYLYIIPIEKKSKFIELNIDYPPSVNWDKNILTISIVVVISSLNHHEIGIYDNVSLATE